MKIENKKLISVDSSDLVDGKFINHKITEIGDNCFNNMPELRYVSCKNVTTIGSYNFSYNAALTAIGDMPVLATIGSYNFGDNAALTAIGDMPVLATIGDGNFGDNAALTAIGDMPVLATIGDGNFRDNAALTAIKIRKKKYDIKAVDGTCFVIQNRETSKGIIIYSGYNINSMQKGVINKTDCFVAEKDGFFAHGTTKKVAIEDVKFKIVCEKLKNDPIKEDTLLTVNYYRMITGACDLGVREFMKQNGLEFEIINPGTSNEKTKEVNPITAKELLPLLVKNNAYGLEKFRKLLTFN
ncbi:MAG: leucine-rich repeat protein [Chitinophagales bacterium]